MKIDGKTFPDFLIVGAAKAGTTSLYYWLKEHSAIYMPRNKEPSYFSIQGEAPSEWRDYLGDTLITTVEDYNSIFEDANPEQICGEASTSYLYTSNITIDLLRNTYGVKAKDLTIIIVLRNPIERAYSHFMYLKKTGAEERSFKEAMDAQISGKLASTLWDKDYFGYSLYCARVKQFVEAFPKTLIFLFEDLKQPQLVANKIFDSLNLNYINVDTNLKANPSGVPINKGIVNLLFKDSFAKRSIRYLIPERFHLRTIRLRDSLLELLLKKPAMERSVKEKLIGYYRDDVDSLSQLISRDLSSWLK